MSRIASSSRKCPKQQIRGYTELKRSEEQLRSEVLALRERIMITEVRRGRRIPKNDATARVGCLLVGSRRLTTT
jgi:hypothetical protein